MKYINKVSLFRQKLNEAATDDHEYKDLKEFLNTLIRVSKLDKEAEQRILVKGSPFETKEFIDVLKELEPSVETIADNSGYFVRVLKLNNIEIVIADIIEDSHRYASFKTSAVVFLNETVENIFKYREDTRRHSELWNTILNNIKLNGISWYQ